jgi:hypothetical protein
MTIQRTGSLITPGPFAALAFMRIMRADGQKVGLPESVDPLGRITRVSGIQNRRGPAVRSNVPAWVRGQLAAGVISRRARPLSGNVRQASDTCPNLHIPLKTNNQCYSLSCIPAAFRAILTSGHEAHDRPTTLCNSLQHPEPKPILSPRLPHAATARTVAKWFCLFHAR